MTYLTKIGMLRRGVVAFQRGTSFGRSHAMPTRHFGQKFPVQAGQIREFAAGAAPTRKVAIVLSGNGVFDGSEITEAVAATVHLSKAGYTPVFYAPDREQSEVMNHYKGEPMSEKRNVLQEAARIARGKIQPLTESNVDDADAVVFPGGFGAAKNLSDFAVNGPDMSVDPDVERILQGFHSAQKPIGLCCIAPVLAARVLKNVEVTVGSDQASDYWPYAGTAGAIDQMGAKHVVCEVSQSHTDSNNKVVTSPAYMAEAKPHEVFDSVGKMIDGVCKFL